MRTRAPLALLLVALVSCDYYCGAPCEDDGECVGGFCVEESGFCNFAEGCRSQAGCGNDGLSCISGECIEPPPVADVKVGQGFACALVATGEALICWGRGPAELLNTGPVDRFDVGDDFVCFGAPTGEHRCLGADFAIGDDAVSFATSRNAACFIQSGDGAVVCEGEGPSNAGLLTVEENAEIALWVGDDGQSRLCVTRSNGSGACVVPASEPDVFAPGDGVPLGLIHPAASSTRGCATRRSALGPLVNPPVLCAPQELVAGTFSDALHEGHIAAGDEFYCFQTDEERMACTSGLDVEAARLDEPTAFDAGRDSVCWVEAARVQCATLDDEDAVVTELPW